SVSYPGQRSRERVVLVNEGTPVDLQGWQLVSPRGQVYTFSNVVLLSFLNVNTTRGTDTPTDLFWNLDEAVWRSGDTVTLKRGEEIIATFVVP
ncbi:MAG: lamin tail domain-containing protein, partial [Thermoflexales bacterium]|nr:lamin tail domain-containing protein [Thermoflexales bacterium]